MENLENSSTNGNGNGATYDGRLSRQDIALNMLINEWNSRAQLRNRLTDPRRDISKECGHPDSPDIDLYQRLYDRFCIATRVVQVIPFESWQVQPTVYEDENVDNITEFEKRWDALGKSLQTGKKSWYKSEYGSPIWEYIRRVDELSGIGHFGILLIGIDDGKPLNEPVEGVEANGVTSLPINTPPGTDAQYFNTTLNPPLPDDSVIPMRGRGRPRKKAERNLIYMRAFSERLVQITQYDSNQSSPRYREPIMYSITLNDPNLGQESGVGMTTSTVNVHWTRVLHVADNIGSSEVFGVPRQQPVLDRLLDLQKVYGGSAEMYWLGAFFGLSIETHPSMGGDVPIDKDAMRAMMENYMNGTQRFLALSGMGAKSLAPQVADPTNQINVQLEAICIQLGVPVRVFKGSERGQLASTQDASAWNDRLRARQNNYLTPKVIVPLVDRLIAMGVLPEPEDGYCVEWPALDSFTDNDKANIALTKTKAIAAYVTGGGPTVMAPMDFFTRILGFNESEASEIVELAKELGFDMLQQAQYGPNAKPPAQSGSNRTSSNGSNGTGGGNNTQTSGDKKQFGRSPAPMHLPVEVSNSNPNSNSVLNSLTVNVDEIADEFGLTEEERSELYENLRHDD